MENEIKSWVPHPGEYIKEELDARGWNQRDLAFIIGCPEQALTLILNGKRGISMEMAKQLGEAFEVSPELFSNLQRSYEMANAPEPNPGIAKRARIQTQYPIREMIKREWIRFTEGMDLENLLTNYFEVSGINEVPYLSGAHAAKRSNYEERGISPIQLAWLYRVRQIAKTMPVCNFSHDALAKAVERMKSLLVTAQDVRHVPRILSECGVRFIMVESLPKSKIDGVTFWLNDHSPVIGLSSRFDRIDNFWYVLRHEIEHVLKGDGKNYEVLDSELDQQDENISEEEKIANAAALEFCVPSKKLNEFIARKSPFFSENLVLGFARINNIHPGLVVGQIQHRINRYSYLRAHQVKIRQFVLPGSIYDGWGRVASI